MLNPLHFNDAEIELLYDAAIYERKRMLTQKIFVLFENIRVRLKDTSLHKQFPFPEGVDIIGGKISQGENYLGYPWVMLDFPKMFNKESHFAFRTLAWYGNYFTGALLISGALAPVFLPRLLSGKHLLSPEVWFSIHPDPWYHAIDEKGSRLVHAMTVESITAHVQTHGYLKLSMKWTNINMEEIADAVVKYYEEVLAALL